MVVCCHLLRKMTNSEEVGMSCKIHFSLVFAMRSYPNGLKSLDISIQAHSNSHEIDSDPFWNISMQVKKMLLRKFGKMKSLKKLQVTHYYVQQIATKSSLMQFGTNLRLATLHLGAVHRYLNAPPQASARTRLCIIK